MTTEATAGIVSNTVFVIVALVIFAAVSFNFLFPCNCLVPLDRRTTAVVGALACYLTGAFLFPAHRISLLHAIDFDVLVLLASIMIINHLIVHLKETKQLLVRFQLLLRKNHIMGFWTISFVAFIVSPFLTNDGVCLLFVEPLLLAFDEDTSSSSNNTSSEANVMETGATNKLIESSQKSIQTLTRSDSVYFLLALACSTNIGSALTYTGNPQNMIVASDSISVMPPYKFLCYMLLPGTLSWFITTKWIERCWLQDRQQRTISPETTVGQCSPTAVTLTENPLFIDTSSASLNNKGKVLGLIAMCASGEAAAVNSMSPMSPRRRRVREREKMVHHVVKVVSSPVPYLVIVLTIAMIIMIFVDVMPISALVCVAAIVMVLSVVLGNHWKNELVWEEDNPEAYKKIQTSDTADTTANNTAGSGVSDESLTREDKIDSMNEFFEDLFKSIDYSLLFIFLGLFIVVENLAATGVPRFIWKLIVGPSPFRTAGSIAGISSFVIIASQLLGNVAVIQLAKPNVHELDEQTKRLAWAIISFVATIGGNLTITGSAANIIVAEKANRLDPTISLDFFKHFRVCFWITLLCCVVGALLLSIIIGIDNSFGSHW